MPSEMGTHHYSSLVEIPALGVLRAGVLAAMVSNAASPVSVPSCFSHAQLSFYRGLPTGYLCPSRFSLARAAAGQLAWPRTHLCLHQVDPLGPKLTHTIEDVHHPFVLGHVKHGVNGNEAASPPSSSTGREDSSLC